MTTIITRLFPDQTSAQKAADRLIREGVPKRACTVIAAGDKAHSQMARAKVHESAIDTYAKHLGKGAAVLALHATYKPLGVVRLARELLDGFDTIDAGDVVEEHKLAWTPERATSVLKDHPLFLTIPGMESPGRMSARIGMPLLKRRKAKNNLMAGSRRMSRMFWPMPLVSKNRNARSAMRGGRHMSKAFWPAPLISTGKRRKSVIPRGGQPLSSALGLRTLSARR